MPEKSGEALLNDSSENNGYKLPEKARKKTAECSIDRTRKDRKEDVLEAVAELQCSRNAVRVQKA